MTITNCQPSQANFATDEIDEAVCATRRLAKYLVGATHDGAFKTVCVKGSKYFEKYLLYNSKMIKFRYSSRRQSCSL